MRIVEATWEGLGTEKGNRFHYLAHSAVLSRISAPVSNFSLHAGHNHSKPDAKRDRGWSALCVTAKSGAG
jgi:hypothetical protein